MTAPAPLMLGRYALFEEIARGGMAAVHFGRLMGPVGFSRTVAIKRMHAHCARDPEFVIMFLEEARMAARIRHPNVVPTLDVVALDNEVFLVMDFVQGAVLSHLTRQAKLAGETVPLPVLSSILVGALLGLHAAHDVTDEQGTPLHLVHRDVSPQNIIVGTDGVARVLDFGVAKALGNVSHTRDGMLKGKLRYMSPEHVQGLELTRQADLWAIGVVLWEAVTQRKMFNAANDADAVMQVLREPIPLPTRERGEPVPDALVAVIMRSLSRDLDERYPNALAMATALREAVRPADQWDVGEWVKRVAGQSVDARAARLREIESISSVTLIPDPTSDGGVPSARLAMLSGVSSGTGAGVAASIPPQGVAGSVAPVVEASASIGSGPLQGTRNRTRATLVAGALAFVVLASGVGALSLRGGPRSDRDAASPGPGPGPSAVGVTHAEPAPPPSSATPAAPPSSATPVVPPVVTVAAVASTIAAPPVSPPPASPPTGGKPGAGKGRPKTSPAAGDLYGQHLSSDAGRGYLDGVSREYSLPSAVYLLDMDLRRLAKRGVFGLLGSVVALGVIWVGAHVVLAEARPEPFAKATDLPALPPAEDNGFLTIARATTTRAPSAPKSVPTLTTKPAEFPSWGQVELARGPLRTYLDAAETKAALTLIDGALAKPSFVDGCADRFDTTCTVISLLSATRAESYLVLSLALDGQNDEATRRLERLLRAELSWLHTPRSYVSQRVSLSSARATVHLAGLLAPRLSPTQRATLLPAVAAFATQPVDLSRLVKLTYLEEMAALDYVVSTSSGFHLASPTAPPRAPTLSERFVSQRLLDRGRTERALADRARQTLRWAEKGDVPPPPPTHESESVLAWVYNPVGKILLDSWIAPPQWESTRDDARALVREAAAIDLR